MMKIRFKSATQQLPPMGFDDSAPPLIRARQRLDRNGYVTDVTQVTQEPHVTERNGRYAGRYAGRYPNTTTRPLGAKPRERARFTKAKTSFLESLEGSLDTRDVTEEVTQ